MHDMPCYPYVTKDRRTITNDRDLLDWIREKAGDDMAELVDMRLNDTACYLNDVQNALDVRKIVADAPAVDAAPVVHSKWKMVGADKRGRGGTFVCLACDKCYPFTCDYCPNCGAKMGGEENAE